MSEAEEGASRDTLVDALEEDGVYASGREDYVEAIGGGWTWCEEGEGGVGGDRGWTPHAEVSVTLALRLGRTRMLQLNQRFYSAAAPSGDSGEDPFAKPQLGSGGRLQASPATLPLRPPARATS